MSKCLEPNLRDVASFIEALKEGGIDIDQMEEELTCSTMNGGSKRSKKGGIKFTTIKYIYIAFMTIMVAYITQGDSIAARGFRDGVEGIFTGECLSVENSVWNAFGWGNPICSMYNTLVTQIYSALQGKPLAIGFLWGTITAITAGPRQVNAIIDGTIMTFAAIVNAQYPGLIELPPVPQIDNGQLHPAVAQLMIDDGLNPNDLPGVDVPIELPGVAVPIDADLDNADSSAGMRRGGRKKSKKSKKSKRRMHKSRRRKSKRRTSRRIRGKKSKKGKKHKKKSMRGGSSQCGEGYVMAEVNTPMYPDRGGGDQTVDAQTTLAQSNGMNMEAQSALDSNVPEPQS